jgi:hypothetical protein
MSLLERVVSILRPPLLSIEREVESFDRVAEAQRQGQAFQRDRTARLHKYIACREAGTERCRIDIAWEDFADHGGADGITAAN